MPETNRYFQHTFGNCSGPARRNAAEIPVSWLLIQQNGARNGYEAVPVAWLSVAISSRIEAAASTILTHVVLNRLLSCACRNPSGVLISHPSNSRQTMEPCSGFGAHSSMFFRFIHKILHVRKAENPAQKISF